LQCFVVGVNTANPPVLINGHDGNSLESFRLDCPNTVWGWLQWLNSSTSACQPALRYYCWHCWIGAFSIQCVSSL